MRGVIAVAAAVAVIVPVPGEGQQIRVEPIDSRPSSVGSEQYFTGTAIISPLFGPHAEGAASGAEVTFAPGARTAWHSHPAGQVLVVTSGVGWVQERGGERRRIEAGDIVWTPPHVEHWHGAVPANAMSHIAIQEAVDGSVVEWLESVSDEEYDGG